MKKQKMTVDEFLKTPNVHPLTEGEPYIPIIGRAIPPDVELTDLKEWCEKFQPRYEVMCADVFEIYSNNTAINKTADYRMILKMYFAKAGKKIKFIIEDA